MTAGHVRLRFCPPGQVYQVRRLIVGGVITKLSGMIDARRPYCDELSPHTPLPSHPLPSHIHTHTQIHDLPIKTMRSRRRVNDGCNAVCGRENGNNNTIISLYFLRKKKTDVPSFRYNNTLKTEHDVPAIVRRLKKK